MTDVAINREALQRATTALVYECLGGGQVGIRHAEATVRTYLRAVPQIDSDPSRLAALEAENALLRSELDGYHVAALKKLQDVQDVMGDIRRHVEGRALSWADLPTVYRPAVATVRVVDASSTKTTPEPDGSDPAWRLFNGGAPTEHI